MKLSEIKEGDKFKSKHSGIVYTATDILKGVVVLVDEKSGPSVLCSEKSLNKNFTLIEPPKPVQITAENWKEHHGKMCRFWDDDGDVKTKPVKLAGYRNGEFRPAISWGGATWKHAELLEGTE